MVSIKCLAHDDPDRLYNYCPSFPAAIIFAILFSGTTIFHLYQAFRYRKSFAWVLIMGGLWEIAGYVFRTLSIINQAQQGFYTAQLLLILLAPLWINAFIYMTLGRLIHFFLRNDRVGGIRARRITFIFVLFDIAAFLVQATGGTMSSGTDIPVSTIKIGLKVYTGGVGLQLGFIAVFCAIAIRFQALLKKQDETLAQGQTLETMQPYPNTYARISTEHSSDEIDYSRRTFTRVRPLLNAVWIALSLIIVRNIYRLVEFGIGGVDGNTITNHEWWMYVFDAVPMFAALIVINRTHPGRVLQGPRCDFKEEDKARKAEKKAKKATKKATKKAAKKAAKKGYQVQKIERPKSGTEQLV